MEEVVKVWYGRYPVFGYLPLAIFTPLIVTRVHVASVDIADELSHRLVPIEVQELTVVNPVMFGFTPVPYAPMLMVDLAMIIAP